MNRAVGPQRHCRPDTWADGPGWDGCGALPLKNPPGSRTHALVACLPRQRRTPIPAWGSRPDTWADGSGWDGCFAPQESAWIPNPCLGCLSSAPTAHPHPSLCLLYTSDAADDLLCVD